VRGTDRVDDLRGGLGGDERPGGAPDAHRRQRRQGGAVLGHHHQSSWTIARQRPRTLSPELVTVSSTVACRDPASSDFTAPATSMLAPPWWGTTTGLVKRVP